MSAQKYQQLAAQHIRLAQLYASLAVTFDIEIELVNAEAGLLKVREDAAALVVAIDAAKAEADDKLNVTESRIR